LVTYEEEKKYFDLHDEYKDVFTWSYQDMPRLNPKVAIHCLSVRKGDLRNSHNDVFALK